MVALRGTWTERGLVCLAVAAMSACASRTRSLPPSRFDADGDGRAEILVVQPWDRRVVRIDEVDGVVQTLLTLEPEETVVRAADMDGDGRGEIAVRTPGRTSDVVRIYRGRIEGIEEAPWATFEVGTLRNIRRAGDLDADGLADLVAVGFGDPSTILFGGTELPRRGPTLEFGGELLTELDVDGDGRDDLLTTDADRAQVYLGGSLSTVEFDYLPITAGRTGLVEPGTGRDLVWTTWGVQAWQSGRLVPAPFRTTGVPYDRGQLIGGPELDNIFGIVTLAPPCQVGIGDVERVDLFITVGTTLCGNIGAFVVGDLDGDQYDDLAIVALRPDGARGLTITHGGRDGLSLGRTVWPMPDGPVPVEDLHLVVVP